MKPKFHCVRNLAIALSVLINITYAQAATYTWSNLDNNTPVINGNWSGGESWSAAPVSAADTTLSIGYTYATNSAAETNTLTNDIANPFLLNVLSLTGNSNAGNGSSNALINIAGSPLEFVSNGSTTPQVNLSSVRTNGQVITFNVQSNLVLTNNTLFTGNGTASFTVSGGISGAGNLSKSGTSKLVLSGTNSFAGTITISGGILQLTNQVSLYNNTSASWTASNISVASGATLALNVGGAGQFTTGNVTTLLSNLSGANGSSTTGFAAGSAIAFDTTGGTFTVSDNVINSTGTGGGAFGVTKWGTNLLTLTGANTYTGTTSILQGSLTLAPTVGGMSLGALTATTSGAGFAAGNITLTLGGAGTNSITSITETSGAAQQLAITKNTTATWSVGNVDLKGGNTSRVSAGILNLDGTLKFGLGGVSTTLRQFWVDGGTLGYNNAGAVQTLGVTSATVTTGQWLTMNGGALDNLSGAAITTSTHNPNLMLNANLTFTGSNSLNFGTGRVSLGSTAGLSRTITVSANTLTLGGIISNGTTATALTKEGSGTLKLDGINSYTGATAVNAGSLEIALNGSTHASSAVTVSNSGSALVVNGTVNGTLVANVSTTLSGTGTIAGATTINGVHAPGNSPGIQIFTNGLSYGSTATLNTEFVGNTLSLRGTDFDGVNVTGGNLVIDSLATLALFTSSIDYANVLWDSVRDFTIIDYSGAGTSTGSFLLNTDNAGAYASEGSWSLANSSNDIILSWTPIPEPSTALLAALGALALFRRRS
ncbi:MAG: beta strand repeat-containing protein [Akkermansiaceae bacterium]|jgi:autotransporter-associated beta strand protein